MHRVHHSDWQPETDSNFSSIVSWWDRLCRIFRRRPNFTLFPYTTLFRSHEIGRHAPRGIEPQHRPQPAFAQSPPVDRLRRKVERQRDRKSTRLNSSHTVTSYAVFCLKKKSHRLAQHAPGPPFGLAAGDRLELQQHRLLVGSTLSDLSPPTQFYTLSLHDALPISRDRPARAARHRAPAPPATRLRPIAARRSSAAESRAAARSEEHTSELQSHSDLVCRLLLEKKKSSSRPTCTGSTIRIGSRRPTRTSAASSLGGIDFVGSFAADPILHSFPTRRSSDLTRSAGTRRAASSPSTARNPPSPNRRPSIVCGGK